MKAYLICKRAYMAAVLLLAVASLASSPVFAEKPTHLDEIYNESGCAACHRGRGMRGTAMLRANTEEVCFDCHGPTSKGKARSDVQSAFGKISAHPVARTSIYHRSTEKLPESDPDAPRHVSCEDCHSAHITEPGYPMKGARGYAPGRLRGIRSGIEPPGLRLKRAETTYEVCYLCHSDSANLPLEADNVAGKLSPSNVSYHPVEAEGRNNSVPSLIPPLKVNSTISCLSCHGNSDSFGARGPHGSDFAPLLKAEYRTTEGPEDYRAYELCYSCHDRAGILADQSFKRHSLHIVQLETSCNTCHDSHGSEMNQYLIDFNDEIVGPSGSGEGPLYIEGAVGAPTCVLICHGKEHNMSGVGDNPWAY